MTTLLSEIYDVTLKRDIRAANKDSWVRPTIGELQMTHRDFEKKYNYAGISGDNFIGTTINPYLWEIKGTDAPTQNDKLSMYANASYYYTWLESNFKIENNFNIQVDFSNFSVSPLTAYGTAGMQIYDPLLGTATSRLVISKLSSNVATVLKVIKIVNDNEWLTVKQINHTGTSGIMRIDKNGSDFSFFYWNNNTFTNLITVNYPSLSSSKVVFYCHSGDNAPNVFMDFNNFKINSGTVSKA